jgi:hypothetical protein
MLAVYGLHRALIRFGDRARQRRLARLRPARVLRAKDAVGDEERAEREGVGDPEDPPPELPGVTVP